MLSKFSASLINELNKDINFNFHNYPIILDIDGDGYIGRNDIEQTVRALVAVRNEPLSTIRVKQSERRFNAPAAADNVAFSETDDGNEPTVAPDRQASFRSQQRDEDQPGRKDRRDTKKKPTKSSKTLTEEQIQRVTNLVSDQDSS